MYTRSVDAMLASQPLYYCYVITKVDPSTNKSDYLLHFTNLLYSWVKESCQHEQKLTAHVAFIDIDYSHMVSMVSKPH